MTKEELIKELELLADSCDSNYALEMNGYNRGVLDALSVPKLSKWTVVEVYYFDCSWYVVQVRQNLRTGYKHFSCKKIVKYHYGTKAENPTPARLEALVNGG